MHPDNSKCSQGGVRFLHWALWYIDWVVSGALGNVTKLLAFPLSPLFSIAQLNVLHAAQKDYIIVVIM